MNYLYVIFYVCLLAFPSIASFVKVPEAEFEAWKARARVAAQARPYDACGAIILHLKTGNIKFMGSGTLVTLEEAEGSQVILTAKHLFSQPELQGDFYFCTASHISGFSDVSQRFKIVTTKGFKDQDIIFALLDRLVPKIKPAKLMSEDDFKRNAQTLLGASGFVAGYGLTHPIGKLNKVSKERIDIMIGRHDFSSLDAVPSVPERLISAVQFDQATNFAMQMLLKGSDGMAAMFQSLAMMHHKINPYSALLKTAEREAGGRGFCTTGPGDSGAAFFVPVAGVLKIFGVCSGYGILGTEKEGDLYHRTISSSVEPLYGVSEGRAQRVWDAIK